MPKKTKPRIAAVIDIGSNELKLQIAQTSKADDDDSVSVSGLKYLENLSYPLWLGRDTFQTGKMSFEKVDKACEVIKNFLTVAASYDVKNIRTVASTAVREATNMDYILDQIKIKTGLTVNVLDDMEEKLYLHKLLSHFISDELKESAMMVYIGSGNIGVSILSEGKMPFLQNIRTGSLRIDELFGDLEEYTSEFYRLMEEYLASYTELIAKEIPSQIKHFIVSGHEIGTIAELTGAKADTLMFDISRAAFSELYHEIKGKTADRIVSDYDIDGEKADVLLPAACIYENLLNMTAAEHITASRILPCDAVLYEMLYPKTFATVNKQFYKNTLMSARALARKFNAQEAHFTRVYTFALTIFDKMKKIHGLGSREKLLLQTAAILHDVGKHINNQNHYRHSYEIVSGADIVGLSQMEREIVALICLYHSRITPTSRGSAMEVHFSRNSPYAQLDVNNRVRISKLAAILRIADALDRSHTQKFDRIAVKVTDEALLVSIATNANIALEQWSFNDKGRFFEEVFGIKAIIRIKRVI